jgi:Xaa-Pro aminopeptidase
MDYPLHRRQQLQRALAAESLDALLVTHPVNVSYLTNFSGESSFLVLTRDRAVLVSDFRFTEQIAEECPGLDTHVRPTAQTVQQAAAEVLGKFGPRSVGFESNHLTVADHETFRDLLKTADWKPGRDRVEKLRAVKDDSELAQIREAIDFAERAFAVFRALLRPDDSERQLCDLLEATVRKVGGQGSSFPPIVAVGPRAALPHAPPTEHRVGEAGLLLVDWGASGRFYKSDLTRVLATRHNPKFAPERGGPKGDAKLAEVYAVVATAQQKAISLVRPGAKGHDVDAAARGVIAEAGYGDCFGHGLGHGLGMQVHEAPAVRPNSEAILEPGMVVTIEPGVYLPGWGGVRIEDDVLVTPDGCEVLTHVSRDLRELSCSF